MIKLLLLLLNTCRIKNKLAKYRLDNIFTTTYFSTSYIYGKTHVNNMQNKYNCFKLLRIFLFVATMQFIVNLNADF